MDSDKMADTAEQKILEALQSGDYTVSYMAPQNITQHTAPDGRTFYIIDPWDDSDCGCEIKAAGYTFTGWVSEDGGVWECDDGDVDLDDDLCDALDEIDQGGIGGVPEQDLFVRFYELANGCSCDEIYCAEGGEPPIDAEDVKSPSECGFESVEFNGKTYHLVGEDDTSDDEESSEHRVLAIVDDAVADDTGKFSCVTLVFDDEDGERGVPVGVEESEETYDGTCEEEE